MVTRDRSRRLWVREDGSAERDASPRENEIVEADDHDGPRRTTTMLLPGASSFQPTPRRTGQRQCSEEDLHEASACALCTTNDDNDRKDEGEGESGDL